MPWFKKISGVFTKRKIDAEALSELEDLLIMSDLGVEAAADITQKISKEKFDKEITPDQSKFLNSSIYDFKEISNQIIAKTDTRSAEFISNLNGIKAKLVELDNLFGLFTKIVNNYGFPIWDRPLISANYGNAKYVYYFPLIHGSNDLINGYFKVMGCRHFLSCGVGNLTL